jgi:hypothetical protein
MLGPCGAHTHPCTRGAPSLLLQQTMKALSSPAVHNLGCLGNEEALLIPGSVQRGRCLCSRHDDTADGRRGAATRSANPAYHHSATLATHQWAPLGPWHRQQLNARSRRAPRQRRRQQQQRQQRRAHNHHRRQARRQQHHMDHSAWRWAQRIADCLCLLCCLCMPALPAWLVARALRVATPLLLPCAFLLLAGAAHTRACQLERGSSTHTHSPLGCARCRFGCVCASVCGGACVRLTRARMCVAVPAPHALLRTCHRC